MNGIKGGDERVVLKSILNIIIFLWVRKVVFNINYWNGINCLCFWKDGIIIKG